MEPFQETAEVSDGMYRVGTAYYTLTAGFCRAAAVESYGVSVTLHRTDGANESCTIEDICCAPERVRALLCLLCRHTVTPVTVRDVVEDYLASL